MSLERLLQPGRRFFRERSLCPNRGLAWKPDRRSGFMRCRHHATEGFCARQWFVAGSPKAVNFLQSQSAKLPRWNIERERPIADALDFPPHGVRPSQTCAGSHGCGLRSGSLRTRIGSFLNPGECPPARSARAGHLPSGWKLAPRTSRSTRRSEHLRSLRHKSLAPEMPLFINLFASAPIRWLKAAGPRWHNPARPTG